MTKKGLKKKVLNRTAKIAMAAFSLMMITAPVKAVDPDLATQVLGNEGGAEMAKETLNAALKTAKSKPALATATGIVCLACVPAAGVSASPGLCIACGILIAKTFG